MSAPLRVGDKLYGYCGGEFGRDSYGTKRVEAIGADWVVARGGYYADDNLPEFALCNPDDLCEHRTPPEDEST